jgi:hypothetical protein
MMDFINSLIDSYNIPILTAFLLGILTSISPCPLATNITAIAYISKEIKTIKHTLLSGLLYTLGRGISYTILASLIYFGLSSFQISNIFQGWGDKNKHGQRWGKNREYENLAFSKRLSRLSSPGNAVCPGFLPI